MPEPIPTAADLFALLQEAVTQLERFQQAAGLAGRSRDPHVDAALSVIRQHTLPMLKQSAGK